MLAVLKAHAEAVQGGDLSHSDAMLNSVLLLALPKAYGARQTDAFSRIAGELSIQARDCSPVGN